MQIQPTSVRLVWFNFSLSL